MEFGKLWNFPEVQKYLSMHLMKLLQGTRCIILRSIQMFDYVDCMFKNDQNLDHKML